MTPLAWRNVVHEKTRTAIVLASVGFAVLLLFIQVGFYTSCRLSATLLYEMLDFDLCVTSSSYAIAGQPPDIPRRRLYQLRARPEVAAAQGVRVGLDLWRNPRDGDLQNILTLAVDPGDRPFRVPRLNEQLPRLAALDTVLVDEVAHRRLGGLRPGETVEVAGRDLRVAGSYRWGVGFTALGAMVTADRTYEALHDEAAPQRLSLVLLRLRPGSDPSEAAAALGATLPPDVRVWTRARLFRHERSYWMRTKPMGLMFTSGVVIALIVGVTILYQVLSADVTKRLPEYATLKAIGYAPRQVQAVIVRQGLLLGLLGFVPAAALATLVYGVLRGATDLPIFMTPAKLAGVLLASLVMCALSGALAMRRVTLADPADLF